MPTILRTPAIERSTYIVAAAFVDETGAAVVPDTGLTWSLTDAAGNVVNGRSAVPIASAASVNIVLTGADLAISDAYRSNARVLTIEGTYTSTIGAGLAIRDQVEFEITNLAAVV